MSDEVAQVLGYDTPKGAVIEGVAPDSPAASGGLRNGDIILAFNDTEITDLRDLTRAVAQTTPETTAQVTLLRKGKTMTRDITIGLLKRDAA